MSNQKQEPTEKKDEADWQTMRPQLLKLALELGPLVVFYIAKGMSLRRVWAHDRVKGGAA